MRTLSTSRSVIALLSLSGVVACAARTPRESNAHSFTSRVDSAAAHLAELELQRISLLANTPTDSVAMEKLDAQMAALREGAEVLANRDLVRERVILALDARASTVTERLRELRLVYTDSYPTVRQMADEERLLRERKARLQPSH